MRDFSFVSSNSSGNLSIHPQLQYVNKAQFEFDFPLLSSYKQSTLSANEPSASQENSISSLESLAQPSSGKASFDKLVFIKFAQSGPVNPVASQVYVNTGMSFARPAQRAKYKQCKRHQRQML